MKPYHIEPLARWQHEGPGPLNWRPVFSLKNAAEAWSKVFKLCDDWDGKHTYPLDDEPSTKGIAGGLASQRRRGRLSRPAVTRFSRAHPARDDELGIRRSGTPGENEGCFTTENDFRRVGD